MGWSLESYQLDTSASLFCLVFRRDRPLGGGGGDGAVHQVVVLAKADARLHVGRMQAEQVNKFLGKLLIHLFWLYVRIL